MDRYNFHTYTKRCGHAVGEDEEYVLAAINNNYKVLGVSDHCPYRKLSVPDQRMEWDKYSDYLNDIKKLKDKYKNDIKIYIGLECEYYPEMKKDLIELKEKCDYLILGQHHYISGDKTIRYKTDKELNKMLNHIKTGIESGLFLYLAHPDYYLRYRPIWDDIAIELCHKICRLSLEYDVPLELNCNGIMMQRMDSNRIVYPYHPFWKIVGEYGCRVCYGVDAHDPIRFTYDYDNELNKLIKDNNLNIIDVEELVKRIGGDFNERTL